MNLFPEVGSFAATQIPATIRAAAGHPFYRRHWANAPFDPRLSDEVSDLAALPLIRREHLGSMEPFIEPGDAVVAINHSTGTSGTLTYRYRTRNEVRGVRRILEDADRATSTLHPPFVLSLHSPGHGSLLQVSGSSIILHGAVTRPRFLDQAHQLLGKLFDAPTACGRIEAVAGPLLDVRVLTQHLMDTGAADATFSMKYVGVFGGYLSRRRSRRLKNFWCIEPTSRFSVAEMYGGATTCSETGALDFDPHIVPRCLDFTTLKDVQEGAGWLALTELHPFGLCQPLINYLTGDVVEVIIASDDTGTRSVRFAGTDQTCVVLEIDGRERLLLSGVGLYEALDGGEVRRGPVPRWIDSVRDPAELAAPLGGVRVDRSSAVLDIEVIYAPVDAMACNARDEIRRTLLESHELLRKLCAAGEVRLRVRPDTAWSQPVTPK